MKALLDFIKTTLIGGALFLLPLIAIVALIRGAMKQVEKIVHPIVDAFPRHSVMGIHFATLLALLILIGVAFLAGLFARTPLGKSITQRAEALVLTKIPGYTLLKGMTRHQDLGIGSDLAVVLAKTGDGWVLGFIVEKVGDLLAVFIPSVPTPLAGSVYYMTEEQVRRLDLPVATAIKCIMKLGVGSNEMLAKYLPLESKGDSG